MHRALKVIEAAGVSEALLALREMPALMVLRAKWASKEIKVFKALRETPD